MLMRTADETFHNHALLKLLHWVCYLDALLSTHPSAKTLQ